jgi:hypothetical protein
MKWYRGPRADDQKPIGGGSYNKAELGFEAFNFLPQNGEMLGYFQPRLRKGHESTIALERIQAGFVGDELKGVLTVFVATNPETGGQRIVGWYRNATVYRHEQPSSAPERNQFSYFLKTRAEDAILVPESQRSFEIPSGKGAFGQANICYALDDEGQSKKVVWIDEALDYVDSYALENIAQEPESEADKAIDEIVSTALEHGAGFQSNPAIRRAIEDYAMQKAKAHLEKLGYKPIDRHKTESYDFLCNVSGADLFVEVKGMQDDGSAISLTPKEVEHARNYKNSALFIMHSVKVTGDKKPAVSGGKQIFLHPWDISVGTLKPRGFVFTLGKSQRK